MEIIKEILIGVLVTLIVTGLFSLGALAILFVGLFSAKEVGKQSLEGYRKY